MTTIKDELWFDNFKNEFESKKFLYKENVTLVDPEKKEKLSSNISAFFKSYGTNASYRQLNDLIKKMNVWSGADAPSIYVSPNAFKCADGKHLKWRFATAEEINELMEVCWQEFAVFKCNHNSTWLNKTYNKGWLIEEADSFSFESQLVSRKRATAKLCPFFCRRTCIEKVL